MRGLKDLVFSKGLLSTILVCFITSSIIRPESLWAQSKKTSSKKSRSTYSSKKKKKKASTKKKNFSKKKAVSKRKRRTTRSKVSKRGKGKGRGNKSAPPKKAAASKISGVAEQQKVPPDQVTMGKSVDLSEAFIKKKQKPFSYEPVDPVFWEKIQGQLEANNQESIIILSTKQQKSAGSLTPEGGEAQLAMAIAFMQKRLYFAAFFLLTKLVQDQIGTHVGEGALYYLSQLTQASNYDQHVLTQLLGRNEFGELHPEVLSFVSYHKGMELLQLGFKVWANIHLNRIEKDSYWDYLLKYWTAIGEVARDRINNATKIFQKLIESPELPPSIFEKTAIQYARLMFEQGDFSTASAIYDNLRGKVVREVGRLNLERAWVFYYQKNYSQAMGLLTALQSPYFKPSITFERHILEMIIYRELCHHKAVESVAQRFRSNFSKSLKSIRQRKPLRHDKILFNMAVLDKEVQELANLINQMRNERKILAQYSWKEFNFYQLILKEYKRMDKILQARIDLELEEKVRYTANELLDAEEQMLFLEYTSKLDELRIRRGDSSGYKTKEASYLTFEKIYWPADGEFWWDEMPDYRMLISSRCEDMTSSDEDEIEREFK